MATIAIAALVGTFGLVAAGGGAAPSGTGLGSGQPQGADLLASTAISGFTARPGAAVDVGVGANGSAWVVGTNPKPGGFGIWRWTGTGWTVAPGAGVAIAVGPGGDPWVVNSSRHIYHWNGTNWTRLSGAATDVGVGANGSAWVVGTNPKPGGFGIWRWTGTGWTAGSGAAIRIAVGPGGDPWVVNSSRHIYHWNGTNWTRLSGAATDVGVSGSGSAWVVGNNSVSGGSGIWDWTGTGWAAVAGGAVRMAVDPKGNPWVVNSTHQIWSYGSIPVPPSPSTCTSSGTGSFNYTYSGTPNSNGFNTYVNNNMWAANPGTTQTLCPANPGSWTVTANAGADFGGVQTYPDAQQLFNDWTGTGWNGSSTMTDTPISALANLTSIYATTNPSVSVGSWEAGHDIWLNNYSQEIMIWVYTSTERGNGGSTVDAHTTLSGVPVTFMNFGSELILQLDNNQAAGSIDMLQALKYLQTVGQVAPDAQIADIDFGWEICNTGGQSLHFAVSSYSISGS